MWADLLQIGIYLKSHDSQMKGEWRQKQRQCGMEQVVLKSLHMTGGATQYFPTLSDSKTEWHFLLHGVHIDFV